MTFQRQLTKAMLTGSATARAINVSRRLKPNGIARSAKAEGANRMGPSKYIAFYNSDGKRDSIEFEAWHFDQAVIMARSLLTKKDSILCVCPKSFCETHIGATK